MPRIIEKYDLFLFDWDGVLIRLYKHTKLYGRLISAIVSIEGAKHYSTIFDESAYRKGQENMILGKFLNFFIKHFIKPRLNYGVNKIIKELKRHGKLVAVFSNGNKGRIMIKMEKLGIRKYFDLVSSNDEIGFSKPNPAGLIFVAKALKVRPERCLYIGDKHTDIMAARYAHMHSCAIADGFDSYARLAAMKPDYIFKNMDEFYNALFSK